MADRPAMDLTTDLVALCHREIPRGPARPGFSFATPEDFDRTTDAHLAEAGDDPILVFAYGSLIWKPEVPVARHIVARARMAP